MSIQVTCDGCFTDYKLKDELAGKKVRCKECGAVMKVPALEVDDLEDADDLEFDEPAPKAKSRKPPPLPAKKKAKPAEEEWYDEEEEDFEPEFKPKRGSKSSKTSSKSSGKSAGKSRKGPRIWLDGIPNSIAISVMWVTIIGLCTLIGIFGRGKANANTNPLAAFMQDDGDDGGNFNDFNAGGGGHEDPTLRDGFYSPGLPEAKGTSQTLRDARAGFKTQVIDEYSAEEEVEVPPPQIFQQVQYSTSLGQMAAYITPNPNDGQKRPAIVWITGGDCNTIGDVWTPQAPNDDQTAAAYRQAGIVMLFPSLRGGNENPGYQEGFYGEVEDILAATEFLAQQPHVDPSRIYLGGHSTGGTMTMLVAEYSDRYRAVFSFGPVGDVSGYGDEMFPINIGNPKEVVLRSPGYWLHCVKTPLFVLEGEQDGNLQALKALQRSTQNPAIKFIPVPRANHFSVLAPVNKLLAAKILQDTGETTNLTLTPEEIAPLF